jgi:uncharacterized protein YbjT (DUF2867 family)
MSALERSVGFMNSGAASWRDGRETRGTPPKIRRNGGHFPPPNHEEDVMKVLVIGATGGSGRAAVRHLLARGHEVTAMARGASSALPAHERLRIVRGDATDEADVRSAVSGQDAVIVTLGISENPLRVRMFGAARTQGDVRSVGTRKVIAAMRAAGVRRLVVQTTFGVGATEGKLGLLDRLFFALLLAPQVADTAVQETAVTESGLDWVLVQPVHLTDADDDVPAMVSASGEVGQLKVSRASVGRFLADAVESPRFVRCSVALSGVPARSQAPIERAV